MSKTHNLFISHSWSYDDHYDKLKEWLDDESYFSYNDHSVPKDDPIHTNGDDEKLKEAIDNKIKGTHAILIMAGVYASYSDWIDKEIKIAKKYSKPIIAIEPWGSEKTSAVVKKAATKIVKWNSSSVIEAIKKCSTA